MKEVRGVRVGSCEEGEGVWIQDIPGAPERNGCVVAEGFGEDHTN